MRLPDKRLLYGLLWYLCCLVFVSAAAHAQRGFPIRERYTKADFLIPMRDGTRLYTVVFSPKDTSRTYPVLMQRTPYSVYYGSDQFPGGLGPSRRFMEEGFIFVYQDVRGTYMSEGEYANVRPLLTGKAAPKDFDESTDTYDTIEWLIKSVPNNNGRVGMWGISYPGFYAAAGAVRAHPALKAVSPQAPIADWFLGDDIHHNGAFFLLDNFAWEMDTSFDRPRPQPRQTSPSTGLRYNSNDSYRFYLDLGPLKNANARFFKGEIPFWNELMAHETYDGYWQARSLLPHYRHIRPAMLFVGGWFDAEDLSGPLNLFKAVHRNSPGTANFLAFGPWSHGGWAFGDRDSFGDIPFREKTGPYYREQIEFPFFNYYLKGIGAPPSNKAQVFATGSNQWMAFDSWPPRDLKSKSLYFQPGGKLTFAPPTGDRSPQAQTASDAYVSDPANPVPYIGTASASVRRRNEYMIADQRFASKRSDVLTYQTEPLTEDLTIYGPITADLFVSTTGTDADWIVKVIDVTPEDATERDSASGGVNMAGYQRLVRADVLRGKFRNSFTKPEPFVPGKPTRVKYDLPDVCHTFLKGHRLMVQVQSSWFPLVDRNPQKFLNIRQADESDFQAATNRLFHTPALPSRIVLGVRMP